LNRHHCLTFSPKGHWYFSASIKNANGAVKITGKTASGPYRRTITVNKKLEDLKNTALKYLWAREKIARLDDYSKVGSDVKEEVTQLGLAYNLMTQYTLFCCD